MRENENNPDKFWSTIKKLYPSKTKRDSSASFQTENGSISEPEQISNGFSHFFSSIVNSLKVISIPLRDFVWRCHFTIKSRTTKRFNLQRVSVETVIKIMKSLKRKKAVGIDQIPGFILKDCTRVLAVPLTYIVNLSLSNGQVPSDWKTAKITPVYKSGTKNNFDNYRPISVIPAVAKIIEKIVHRQLNNYLEENKLLHQNQYGFRAKRSTNLATIFFTDSIRHHVDKGKMAGAIYIDLSKAFDTLSHGKLLSKLTAYGIWGNDLEWFTDYLFNRKQFVVYNGVLSEKEYLTVGVPQGTILGPLLFLLYFNDLPVNLKYTQIVKYADDTVLFCGGKTIEVIETELNHDMDEISKWCYDNELILNMKKGKTEAMMFGTPQKLKNITKPLCIKYRNEVVNTVTHYKYLGTELNTSLNLNEDFNLSYKKTTSRLRLLLKIRPYLTVKAAKTIYQATIVPVMTYSRMINLNLTSTQRKKLQSIDDRARKIIPSDTICSIESTIKKNCCVLVRKCIDCELCVNFNDYFVLMNHNHNTRNAKSLLRLPAIHTEYGRRSFKFMASKYYNDLPRDIVSNDNFNSFKIKICEHFK